MQIRSNCWIRGLTANGFFLFRGWDVVIAMNSVKIMHAVRSAITAIAKLLVWQLITWLKTRVSNLATVISAAVNCHDNTEQCCSWWHRKFYSMQWTHITITKTYMKNNKYHQSLQHEANVHHRWCGKSCHRNTPENTEHLCTLVNNNVTAHCSNTYN